MYKTIETIQPETKH